MEKCTFCVQRIRRATREGDKQDGDRALNPACVNACPTETLFFGDFNDPNSKVSKINEKESKEGGRAYRLMEHLDTKPSVIYLKKIDEHAEEKVHHD